LSANSQDEVAGAAASIRGESYLPRALENALMLWIRVATGEWLLLLAMPEGGGLAILPDGRFDGDEKGLAQMRINHGLALNPREAFPELRLPDGVRPALARLMTPEFVYPKK
jgi:hypothetical protein